MSSLAGAVQPSSSSSGTSAQPADWARLGDLLQVIAGAGDHLFLAMLTKHAEYHIALILAPRVMPPGE
jgi:hypothetical protein